MTGLLLTKVVALYTNVCVLWE